ncbi:MAG: hypothetical protein GY846_07115 [Deltaproteobacteria bacterium]|nr:hypothetical protein [Deltaproteobacteria bacterium]
MENFTDKVMHSGNVREQLRQLRIYTNYRAGVSVCAKVLSSAGGDMEKAKDIFLEKGFAEEEKPAYSFPRPKGKSSTWAYIVTKAQMYLKMGTDIYRCWDALGMPDPEWDVEILDEVSSCFAQFTEVRGFSRENPVLNVSVEGFNAAAATLHFEVVLQAACLTDDGEGLVDAIRFKHRMDKSEITLFNKVDFLEDPFLSSL